MSAGLLGRKIGNGPFANNPMTLAAKIVNGGGWFVLNAFNPTPWAAWWAFVVPGTGVTSGVLGVFKPNGIGSPFPYGFDVISDRDGTVVV